MIAALIGYGFVVGALAALAAWLVERAQVAFDRPRKHAWMGGIVAALLVPGLVLWLREPGEGVVSTLTTIVQTQVQGAAISTVMPLPAASAGGETNGGSLNAWLAALWALTSGVLVSVYTWSAWRLSRRARSWHDTQINSLPVSIAPDVGPAVFGWTRSRVVFPRWLTEAPAEVQSLALAHEREHVSARDPQVLSAATLLAALLPWNLPMLWMLRRLRFAMEVDCDARVIQRGADPNDYGLALLYVSERQSRAPITAIALIERKSQLERRINFMFTSPRRYPALVAGACLALAGSCLFAAAQLQAPGLASAGVILKLPPGGANSPEFRLGQQFEVLLRERYPELLQGQFTDTPVIVVLLNEDMTIANSVQIASSPPDRNLAVTPALFAVLGVTPEQMAGGGVTTVQLSPESQKRVIVAYTMSKTSDASVSGLFPDTRKLDRELFAQEFPQAHSGAAAGQDYWLLLDRSGAVLRKGIEPVTSSIELAGILEKRFSGIDTQEVMVNNITGKPGEPMHEPTAKDPSLWCVWLAPGSPLPKD